MLAVALVALGAGYLFWLRDSSLVAVTEVEVSGVRSGERDRDRRRARRAPASR